MKNGQKTSFFEVFEVILKQLYTVKNRTCLEVKYMSFWLEDPENAILQYINEGFWTLEQVRTGVSQRVVFWSKKAKNGQKWSKMAIFGVLGSKLGVLGGLRPQKRVKKWKVRPDFTILRAEKKVKNRVFSCFLTYRLFNFLV